MGVQWGCSSMLQREVLAQNAKKKFWSIWKKFKKRKAKDKIISKKKHYYKQIKKKEQVYYSFLKEVEFCGFDRFSQVLKNERKGDQLQDILGNNFKLDEKFLLQKEYHFKFSNMLESCFGVSIVNISQLDLGEIMAQFGENEKDEFPEGIESSSQKVDNKIKLLTKNNDVRADYSLIDVNEQNDNFSENLLDKFLTTFNPKEDYLHKMIRSYKSKERKYLIKLIRIMAECRLKKNGIVRIILCNEIDYIMFEFFAELLIKFVVFHKNQSLKIESCQFRNGKCYFIKLSPLKNFTIN
jgi:hypothetical protein